MMLRGQVADTMIGSIFVFTGLTACAIAASHRRGGTRILVWLGIWSAMYGSVHLIQSQIVLAISPGWLQSGAPYANTAMNYLLAVFGLLSFRELSLGKMRIVLKAAAYVALAIAVGAMATFVLTGTVRGFMMYNNVLAGASLLLLIVVVAVPRLSRRYLMLDDRRVLAGGTFVFAVEAVYNNLSRPLGFGAPRALDHLGFAALLFSFAYVAVRRVVQNERRLVALDNELALAREIQSSILPSAVPDLSRANVSAAYHPMTAVAGDFYEFLPVDHYRAGFLVADVCGHGVPAAMVASMIKVAVETVRSSVDDPRAVLSGLNRILSRQPRNQLVSAAYLWIDTEQEVALYSGAGHPALLRWRDGCLEQIESNGILFGVLPQFDDYPVRKLQILPGDRFLLYTDGITECQDPAGNCFGDKQLEEVIRFYHASPASDLSDRLLSEVRRWQDASPQQDDITLIIIDALCMSRDQAQGLLSCDKSAGELRT